MYEMHTSDSPHYLVEKLGRGEAIFQHEVLHVLRHNEGYVWRGEMHKLLVMALSDELPRKPGPKPRFSDWEWRCINAAVDFRAEDIREARSDPGYVRCRGDMSPVEEALGEVASQRKLGSGRTLHNNLSSRNLR
jgi:hypothetical protein